jgi:hypothetical protein
VTRRTGRRIEKDYGAAAEDEKGGKKAQRMEGRRRANKKKSRMKEIDKQQHHSSVPGRHQILGRRRTSPMSSLKVKFGAHGNRAAAEQRNRLILVTDRQLPGAPIDSLPSLSPFHANHTSFAIF